MPVLIALLLCLWLPAQATTPCPEPRNPVCEHINGTVVRKMFLEPYTVGQPKVGAPFEIPKGPRGTIDSVVVDGIVMYRVRVHPKSPAPVAEFVLTRPGRDHQWAWLSNAAGHQAPGRAVQDPERPEQVRFVFAKGLAPGQASRWIVDRGATRGWKTSGSGQVADLHGVLSTPQPLLVSVP